MGPLVPPPALTTSPAHPAHWFLLPIGAAGEHRQGILAAAVIASLRPTLLVYILQPPEPGTVPRDSSLSLYSGCANCCFRAQDLLTQTGHKPLEPKSNGGPQQWPLRGGHAHRSRCQQPGRKCPHPFHSPSERAGKKPLRVAALPLQGTAAVQRGEDPQRRVAPHRGAGARGRESMSPRGLHSTCGGPARGTRRSSRQGSGPQPTYGNIRSRAPARGEEAGKGRASKQAGERPPSETKKKKKKKQENQLAF